MDELSMHLRYGRARETSALVNQAIAENYPAETIIKQGFITGLEALEKQSRRDKIQMPEMSLALRALYRGIGQIRQVLDVTAKNPAGTVVIGTIEGDTEETLKNIIAILMEGRGLEVIDLGTCVSVNSFIKAAKEKEAGAIVCSADLVTTMQGMKTLIQALAAAGLREKVKVILTGRPVTERYCRLIGADHYAPNASSAAEMAAGTAVKAAGA
ncbi:MAG: cobalamin-dependent protein [Treponema sp.]|jgi:methanogenic corrinoid protein MtbC1|nr:cobalamin-dependent protein [Treponema sp.]